MLTFTEYAKQVSQVRRDYEDGLRTRDEATEAESRLDKDLDTAKRHAAMHPIEE